MRLVTLAEERAWRERIDALEIECDRLRSQNGLLLTHALIAQPAPVPVPVGLPKRPSNRVSEVIGDVAGSNTRLRKQLGAFARAQKAAGVPESDIVHALLHWDADEDGTAE